MDDTPVSQGRHHPSPVRVLVVGDDPHTRHHVKELLERHGHVVDCAPNDAAATAVASGRRPPDMILLDLDGPSPEAERFWDRQRHDPALTHIPVVLLTAGGVEARRASEVGRLRKPVDAGDLLAAVQSAATPCEPEVLLVDDEPAVLRVLAAALESRGFTVRRAGTGEEAVRVFERHRETIDLVVLDVQMPGLDGPETLAALRRIDAGVRAVFMSGSTGKYDPEELSKQGALSVLQKPFDGLDELARLLRAAARS